MESLAAIAASTSDFGSMPMAHPAAVSFYPRSHTGPQSGNGSPIAYALEGSGTFVTAKVYHKLPQVRLGGGVRQRVTAFSRESRKRMMFACSKICWDSLPPDRLFFITVKTVERGHDSAAWLNKGLGRLRKRMERLFGPSGYACVLKKERGWGGRWHAHLVLYIVQPPETLARDLEFSGGGRLPIEFDIRMRKWLQGAWREIAGYGTGETSKSSVVFCERARDAKAVSRYLLKGPGAGSGKAHQTSLPPGSEPCGKWWSMWGSKAFPRDEVSEGLTAREFFDVRRLMRRWKDGQSSHRVTLHIWSASSPMSTVGGQSDGSLRRSLSEYVRRLREGTSMSGGMNLAAALRKQSGMLETCSEAAA